MPTDETAATDETAQKDRQKPLVDGSKRRCDCAPMNMLRDVPGAIWHHPGCPMEGVDVKECPYAEADWACELRLGHDEPHRMTL